jgi:uncharacterized protein YggU (UPF0235/DUF167 family)
VTQDRLNSEVVRVHPDGSALIVRAVPGAASSCLAGLSGGVLRVRVAVPAVEGKANAALLSFQAGRLGLRGGRCTWRRGAWSREASGDLWGGLLRRSGPRSAWPRARGSHRLGRRWRTRSGSWCLQRYGLLCSVNDAVNVLPYATCAYLNGWLSQPALPFQDDAGFPAAIRLRIWRLGVRIPRGAPNAQVRAHEAREALRVRSGSVSP